MNSSWNRTLRLAGWNWYICRKPLAVILGLATVTEAVLVLWQSSREANSTARYPAVFLGSLCPVVLVAAYLTALAVSLRALAQLSGKTRAGYTLLTLDLSRSQIYLGQVAASAMVLLVVMAWQVLTAAILYWPATAIRVQVAARSLPFPVTGAGGFWNAMAENFLLRLLLPVTGRGFLAWLLFLLGPAVLAPGILLHRGARRVLAICVALAGAVCCLVLAVMVLYCQAALVDVVRAQRAFRSAALILMALMAFSAASCVHALKRAEAV